MPKAALYVRVSTNRQTTDNQLPDLERYADSKDCEIVKVYAENESAWKMGQQHELENCKIAASRREFDVLFVWALDRLTRGGISATLSIVKYFETFNIAVYSDQERWLETIDGTNRELFMAFAGWIAKFESDRKRERINAGLARVKADGKHIGRPKGKKDGEGIKRNRSGYFKAWEERLKGEGI